MLCWEFYWVPWGRTIALLGAALALDWCGASCAPATWVSCDVLFGGNMGSSGVCTKAKLGSGLVRGLMRAGHLGLM